MTLADEFENAPGQPVLNIQVVRGTANFAKACQIACASLAMVACLDSPGPPISVATPAPGLVSAANLAEEGRAEQPDPFTRVPLADTEASVQVRQLISDQNAQVEAVSPEQAQTLAYGVYPPVKTTIRVNGQKVTHWTLHPFDVVRLTREASIQAAMIEGVRVDPAKIGAVLMAESQMVARTGLSANGRTPSTGLGQLEPKTAEALGVADPNNPTSAALAVARLLAEGIRFANANRSIDSRLAISLVYNTSSSLRTSLITQWGQDLTIDKLPVATQVHVKNVAFAEQLMNRFAKLNDQHEASIARRLAGERDTRLQAAGSVNDEEDTFMKKPITAPTTLILFAGPSTEAGNRLRIESNQVELEKAGHLQPVPMTSKGLSDMRLAISTLLDKVLQRRGPASENDLQASTLPGALSMGKFVGDLHVFAQTMVEKARSRYATLRAEDSQVETSKASYPSPSTTSTALRIANENAGGLMAMTSQQLRDILNEVEKQDSPRPS